MVESSFQIPADIFEREQFCRKLKASSKPIDTCKASIEKVTDFLHRNFQNGQYIRDLIHARATFVDDMLACCWDLYEWQDDTLSLIAVGGYGRGELHPHSDIDILILGTDDSINGHQDELSQFITLLWDINLDIGHSVCTIKECVEEAQKDISVVTNLMESRLIAGKATLLEAMREAIDPVNFWDSRTFFRAKWDEQINRHRKHGNSEYNLEPNVKSSPGGLRDIQMIAWICLRHFGSHQEAWIKQHFLREEEVNLLEEGRDFLWKVRYALHMIAGREEDRLLFDHQRTLAKLLGFEDDDARLAVEGFMKQYYRWALALGQLNDVLMQYFDETILRACEAETIQEINPRFRICNGHIEVTNDKVFEKTPSALLEIFVLMAHNPQIDGARAATIRLIRDHCHLIDDDFRKDHRNNRFFMDILLAPRKVALQLRRMSRWGVLGNYLPEYGKIIGQMQHDLFHIYSVDAHTMEVIKNMRRFHYEDFKQRFPIGTRIINRLPRKELLYIAGLYHDIGKGRGGDHSTLGAVDAKRFCIRHGLNRRSTRLVGWLVENHLLMSATAQRKDIHDPDVIREFAEQVGDETHLNYLYLLTAADINATNPTLWNSWRASLLRQLYAETKRTLRRGLDNPVNKQEWIDDTQQSAIDQLEAMGYDEKEIRETWAKTGDDYFLREKVDDIVWQTEAIAQHYNTNEPLVLLKESGEIESEGITQIFVHAKDEQALFALIASALEHLDLNIQDARLYTSGTGLTLDTFYVLENDGSSIGDDPVRIEQILKVLTEQIQDPEKYIAIISRRTPRQMRLFSVPTETTLSDDIKKGYSILEVSTPDRPGLLARIGKIFIDHDVELQNAKIATLGERVEDVFFITKNQQPISDETLCQSIQQAICKELDEQATL
jgi:[protein-PII] uridylyltransferase